MKREPDFDAKVGETFSPRVTLLGADNRPADLTNATAVKLNLSPHGGGTPVYAAVDCAFTPDITGKASYDSPAVISFEAGDYDIDFEVHYPGTPPIVRKFPTVGNYYVKVSRSAAGP